LPASGCKTAQGRTVTEAKQNLIEAAQLFLISCIERGTLDQAMKEGDLRL
jgi:predicted RNase H-like HicB family nuclease